MDITVIAIIWIHFIADFVCQTRWMADNKSKDAKALLYHVAIYTLCLCPLGIQWAVVNGGIHAIQDRFESIGTTWAYKNKRTWLLFTIVGIGQAAHLTVLLVLYNAFGG